MLVLIIIAVSGSLLFYLLQPPAPELSNVIEFEDKERWEAATELASLTNIQL